MRSPREILERALFVGGVPRSGTTFAIRSLNAHPRFVAAIDDRVFECRRIYDYRDRSGIVREIREGRAGREYAVASLAGHLFPSGILVGAAGSPQCSSFPLSEPRPGPGGAPLAWQGEPSRHDLPVQEFRDDWTLCLKSPEISHVLPGFADLFPRGRFLLVHRPLVEAAGSMFRKGETVANPAVFFKRWRTERDAAGALLPPPGIPVDWHPLWPKVTDFQRCVLNAAAYLRAVVQAVPDLPAERVFVMDHRRLREDPAGVLQALAAFLDVDPEGFRAARERLVTAVPPLPPELQEEYDWIDARIGASAIGEAAGRLSRPPAATGGDR